jgi:hypothetical protein
MRSSVSLGMLIIGCTAGLAQEPVARVITVPEVEVRSGPSFNFYATSMLRNGETVLVVNENLAQPGWIAIKPPAGSFSWIEAKSVKRNEKQKELGYVDSVVPVGVMPGSSLTNKAPNVEQVKLEKGAVVAILDEAFTPEAGGSFFPIQPPPNEVRYIPADAIKPQQFVGTPSPSAPNPLPAALSNDLILQADKALQSGNAERAKQLYREAAQKSTDYQQKIYCYNRLVSLGQGPDCHPGHPHQTMGVAMNPSGQVIAQPATASQIQTAPLKRGAAQPPQWSAWGVLRRTAFKCDDGQTMYVLENQKGQALLYVTAQSGLSLSNFIGRTVSVYGPILYRSDDYMRSQYMIASHIAIP